MRGLPAASSPSDIARLISSPVAVAPTPAPNGAPGSVWDEVRRLSGTTRRLKTIVDDLQLLSLAEATAVVKAGALAAMARSAQREIEDVFTRAAGRKITLTFHSESAGREAASTIAGSSPPVTPIASIGGSTAVNGAPERSNTTPSASTDIRQHPLVKQAETLLGARVVRVEARVRTP